MTTDTDTPADYDDVDQGVWTSFRQTRRNRDLLREHAHLARISVSELCRRRVEDKPPPKAAVPALNVRAYAELAQVENNLNQIAKVANTSGQFGPAQLPILVKVLTEFKALNAAWRLSLIGADQADAEGKR